MISTLLIYRALTNEETKEAESHRIRKLEERVLELESVLRQTLEKQESHEKSRRPLVPEELKTKIYPGSHPLDVKFLNYKDRKRILITGGAGFVGSHLTDRLMLAGHEVIVADNMFTGMTQGNGQF